MTTTTSRGENGFSGGVAARIAEFRKLLIDRIATTSRSDRAASAIGLEIERQAHEITNQLGRELMEEAIRAADTHAPEVTVGGETWGARKVRPNTYVTIFGEVRVERSTYQRSGRGRVLVPAEVRLGMVEGTYTPMAARIVTRAVACMPSGEAEDLLSEIGVCVVSRSTIDRLPKAILARVGGDLERIERDVRVRDVIPVEAASVQVGMDGVMLPVEGEGAKRRGRKTKSPQPPRHEGGTARLHRHCCRPRRRRRKKTQQGRTKKTRTDVRGGKHPSERCRFGTRTAST